MMNADKTYRPKSLRKHPAFYEFCDKLFSLSTESNFLGNCFDYSERMPGELISGFFVGRADLQREASIGRKVVHGVIETIHIYVIANMVFDRVVG